jgi:hypothetical protein
MCAWRSRRGRARQARQKSLASVGVSPPIFFLSFFPFVIAGPDPAIHAEVTLEKRFPPSVCLRHVSMDHRHRRPQDAVLRTAMSGGDDL